MSTVQPRERDAKVRAELPWSPRYPFPAVPDGWFAVALSSELGVGDERAVHALGAVLRVARGRDGQIAIRDNEHGSRVYPVHESDGLVYGWHHALGGAPTWWPITRLGAGWSPITTGGWVSRHHPQEVAENTVDSTHAVFLHGFRKPIGVRDAREDGPFWRLAWDLELARSYQPDPDSAHTIAGLLEEVTLAGGPKGLPDEEPVRTTLEIDVCGLGVIDTVNTLPGLGWAHVVRFCLTPIDAEQIRYLVVVSVKAPEGTDHELIAALDRRSLAVATRDARQDSYVFDHKRYLARPAITRAEAQLMRVRRWARQFYSSLA